MVWALSWPVPGPAAIASERGKIWSQLARYPDMVRGFGLHSLSPLALEPALIALVSALVLLLAAAPLQSVQAADELQQFQQRMAQLFRQLDRNGDGRLDRDEARANAYLQRHFDRLDRGDKGYLVPGDLR
jgi:hypothetical protein